MSLKQMQILDGAVAVKPEQEPVAWMSSGEARMIHWKSKHPGFGDDWIPLYTTPPQRKWVGLTNDEVNNFAAGCHLGKSVQGAIYEAEAKLKEKNQ